jgi:hypothetical protein
MVNLPYSRAFLIHSALVSFLNTESIPYKDSAKQGDIDWNYLIDAHTPQLNPKGLIAVDRIFNNTKLRANYEATRRFYDIQLRLVISETNVNNLLMNLQNWEELVVNDFLMKLKQQGVSGQITLLNGESYTINNILSGIIWEKSELLPKFTSDGGGTGTIIFYCNYFDDMFL